MNVIDLGFTGTQDGMTEMQAQLVFNELMCIDMLRSAHHGCCIGSDLQFDEMLGYIHTSAMVFGHPPINTSKMAACNCDVMLEPKEYLVRNHDIVDVTNFLIAAPKGPEEQRSGTWSTVRYARRLGRPITIIFPDGSEIRERQ